MKSLLPIEVEKQPLLLGFDVSSLYRHYRIHSGIPRFVGSLLNALEQRDDIHIVKFVNCSELGNRLDRERLNRAVTRGEIAAVYNSGRCDGINLHSMQLKVIHSTFYHPPKWMLDSGAQWIPTIHDLRPLDNPNSCENRHIELFSRMGEVVAQRSSYIHCVSRYSESRVRDLWKIPASRIRVIHPAVTCMRDEDFDIEHELSSLKPFVLFLGTVQPAKDVEAAISAFEYATNNGSWLHGTRLIVAGSDIKHEPSSKSWNRLLSDQKVIRLKRVNDSKRLALLSLANAVLCTSRYEGFGFVPLEAITLGTPPIISSAYPCLELIPHWPYTFQSGDVSACAKVLNSVLTQQIRVQSELQTTARQMIKWDWCKVASNFANLYSDAMDSYNENAEQIT